MRIVNPKLTRKQAELRDCLMKQNFRENFTISDEEWEKIQQEKYIEANPYKARKEAAKKRVAISKKQAPRAIVHRKATGAIIEIR